MSTTGPKMIYIAAQFRVRVEFSRADCIALAVPPPELLERAKEKLRAERAAGRVAIYRIFKTRLERMWKELRLADVPLSTTVGVTLVTGAPPMPGIEVVAAPGGGGPLAYLSITATPEVVRTWRFKLFKLTVGKYLRRLGIRDVVNPIDIHVAWFRAAAGERIEGMPLVALRDFAASQPDDVPYQLVSGQHGAALSVVVYDVKTIMDSDSLPELQQAVEAAVAKLAAVSPHQFHVLIDEMLNELRSANRGPERFGLDLPFVYLAAFSEAPTERRAVPVSPVAGASTAPRAPASSSSEAASAIVTGMFTPAANAAVKGPRRPPHTLKRHVEIAIAEDSMSVTIKKFDPVIFIAGIGKKSAEWTAFLQERGIAPEAMQVDDLPALVESRQNLQGQCVAKGRAPVAGLAPFLERAKPSVKMLEVVHDADSMREMQQQNVVRAGQVVATFTYKTPPEVGFDVFGKPKHAPGPELPAITVGAGIRAEGPRSFVATEDGIPEVTATSVQLTKVLVIKGNVNLSSGNLHFSGPATINGSIESGTIVEIHGDLIVNGMIQGGLVKVSGQLTVTGGIISGGLGSVRAGAGLVADFIENARVYSGGNVTVNRSITASHVSAVGEIVLTQGEGVVAGSELVSGKDVRCGRFGRSNGPKTKARVGCDPRQERKLEIKRRRSEHLAAGLEKDEAMKAELDRRSQAQMTKGHQSTKADLIDRIRRFHALIARLQEQVAVIQSAAQFNKDARLLVSGTLSSNCSLEIGGVPVVVLDEIAGVAVSSRRHDGSHLTALSGASAPKAS